MKWTSSSQHSRGFDVANLRFMLTGPAAFITLALFGLYFWGLRLIGKTLLRYPWALLVGVPFAISNIIYNVVFASFVFWRFPVWLNTRGQFSPFFTTRMGLGGSGLGLAIVHQMVTQVLRGRVSVESKPGEVSRFTLLLAKSIPHPGGSAMPQA